MADYLSAQKYSDAWNHFQANQFALLIRKFPFPSACNPYTPEETALKKFLLSERKCARMNQFFFAYNSRKGKSRPYERIFSGMRNFITYVIGDEPGEVFNECSFGSGASIGVHGSATNAARKLAHQWSCTPSTYGTAFSVVSRYHLLREEILEGFGGFANGVPGTLHRAFEKKVDIVAYNKLAFVPKTAKTYRSIAIEPSLNGFLQKSIDLYMRKCLKRIQIDLSDQSVNSLMAREGSKEEGDYFCTIDLSSASDSISIGLVKEVLPPSWFSLLNSTRSPAYKYDGLENRYHKFVSMGNGFCFPLQSLLYSAICSTAGCGNPGRDFRVYGDDIIVRKSKVETVMSLLKICGFTLNRDKTFTEGPFRESCGGDWFKGIDVRPYTLDEGLDSIEAFFKILNGSQRSDLTREYFAGVRTFLLECIPPEFRFYRPYPGPADSGIDSVGSEFLTSNCCTWINRRKASGRGPKTIFRERQWKWLELAHTPIRDTLSEIMCIGKPNRLMYAALFGSASDMPFTFRRKTRTNVRVTSHVGATSQWLPPHGSFL